MNTRHTTARPLWRYAPLVLMLCLRAAPAAAQLPDATKQRIVELNVQLTEGRYLRNSHEINDETWITRQRAINAELKPLVQDLRRLPAAEFKRIDSELDGLINARLAILEPQWQARGEKFKEQRDDHERHDLLGGTHQP